MLDITPGELHLRDAAAFGALPAIDRRMDLFRGSPELALDEIVRLDPFAEAEIAGAVLLAETPDLDQICHHASRLQSALETFILPDRLYLSCWIRGFDESNMLRHFEKLLSLFPFSKLARRGPVLRVYVMERSEPPQMEREFPPAFDPAQAVAAAHEFAHADCSLEIDAAWDLWQYDREWKIAPSPVILLCQGPEFENENGDHLRIEFGQDARFLPIAGVEGSLRMGQSNLRSLIHLVNEIERVLPLERRQIWSESGANFADLLAESIARYSVN